MSLDELNDLIKEACSGGLISPEKSKQIRETAHELGVSDSNINSMIQKHLDRFAKSVFDKSSGFIVKEEINNAVNESGFVVTDSSATVQIQNVVFTDSNKLFSEVHNLKTQGRMSLLQKGKLLGKWVAIKRIKPENRNNSVYKSLFHREFENGYFLDHPNIVKLLGKGEDDGGEFYYMEFVDGQPLTKHIGAKGIDDGSQIKKISIEILQALAYIHKKQIVHRDLKPDNILITDISDHVKLIDFGLAKSEGFDEYIQKTGTPKYAAPEQKKNAKTIDGRADIYSFGLILLEMLTGQTEKIQIVKNRNKQVFRIISKSLEIEPANRYKDCDEIIDDLKNVEIRDLSDITERTRKKTLILKIAGIAVGLLVLLKIILDFLAPGTLSLSPGLVNITEHKTFSLQGNLNEKIRRVELVDIQKNNSTITFHYSILGLGDSHSGKSGKIKIISNAEGLIEFESIGFGKITIKDKAVLVKGNLDNSKTWEFNGKIE